MMRLKVLAIAAAITGGLGLASAANATPLSVATADVVAGDAVATNVTYFYGPGYGYGYYGPRPIYRPYGFYGPRRFYGPRYGFYGPRRFNRHYGFYGPRRFY